MIAVPSANPQITPGFAIAIYKTRTFRGSKCGYVYLWQKHSVEVE